MSKAQATIKKIDGSEHDIVRPIKITNFMEGMKWNGAFSGDHQNREYYNISGQLFESITHEFEKGFKGGMVVFSTEVNAVYNKSGFFKSKVKTLINALRKNKKLSDLLSNFEEVIAYSVGNFFRGKYFDRETGKTYDEKSLSVEIIGIPPQILTKIAESIAKDFEQKEVLVKEYDSGRIFMVDKN
jgi:hypothetical protein